MMRYGELVLEVFGSHLGGKMHQGLDNSYLIICYIKLLLVHAGPLRAGQGKGLWKRFHICQLILRCFSTLCYLDTMNYNQENAGEKLQNPQISTEEMAL